MADWTSAGSTACSSRFATRVAVWVSVSGERLIRVELLAAWANPGAFSNSSGRAVPTRSMGTPSA